MRENEWKSENTKEGNQRRGMIFSTFVSLVSSFSFSLPHHFSPPNFFFSLSLPPEPNPSLPSYSFTREREREREKQGEESKTRRLICTPIRGGEESGEREREDEKVLEGKRKRNEKEEKWWRYQSCKYWHLWCTSTFIFRRFLSLSSLPSHSQDSRPENKRKREIDQERERERPKEREAEMRKQ